MFVDQADSATVSRMGKRLKDALKDPAVVARLDVMAEQFWAPNHARFQAWLRKRTLTTIGLGALAAASASPCGRTSTWSRSDRRTPDRESAGTRPTIPHRLLEK